MQTIASLCLLIPVLGLISGCNIENFSGPEITQVVQESHPLNAGGTVVLSNVNGSIEVSTWDKNEVALTAEKFANSPEALARISIKVTAQPDKLSIKTEHEKTGLFGHKTNGGIRYRLQVPASLAQAQITTVNSSIKAIALPASIHFETVNGSITAEALSGDAKCQTVNGSIHLAFVEKPAATSIHLKTVNGSCTLDLPESFNADISARTINGRTRIELPTTAKESSGRNIDARLGKGGSDVHLSTVNGSITVN